MSHADPSSLFEKAQQAFASGYLETARANLLDLIRTAGDHATVLHLLALVEKGLGDASAARRAFKAALALAPNDPQIANNYANLLNALGENEQALIEYNKAVKAKPDFLDARYNRALLLQKMGRAEEALNELNQITAPVAKVHSAKGAVLRDLGRLPEAIKAYDNALAIEPQRVMALHGRARTAMERGDNDASAYYRRAIALNPGFLDLHLGLAEALEMEGQSNAIDGLAAIVRQNPRWPEGQTTLARMRWEAGEGRAFTRDFERAVSAAPEDVELWLAYASSLAGADLHGEAADVIARGRIASACNDERLVLTEAAYRSEVGQLDHAQRLFEVISTQAPGLALELARHFLRSGSIDRAAALADDARSADPWSVSAWALTGLAWRLLDDPRHAWLHEQSGLISTRHLGLSAQQMASIADLVRGLHKVRSHPIGQSLRSGTQTRGRLFDRSEPELHLLREAILAAVHDYWSALPPFDPAHPLLRHKGQEPRLDGSWSVRLTDGGFHVAHVHPRGVVSSACYLSVPEDISPPEGWLEIGAPPAQLNLPMRPIRTIQPEIGVLALFPSTVFHGTRPFSAGERMTVAFDVSTS